MCFYFILFNKYKLLYSRRTKHTLVFQCSLLFFVDFFFFFLFFYSVHCLTFSGFILNKYDIRNDVTVALWLLNARCQSCVRVCERVNVFVYENQRKNITKMHRIQNFFPYLVMRKYYEFKQKQNNISLFFSDLITLFASFCRLWMWIHKHKHKA